MTPVARKVSAGLVAAILMIVVLYSGLRREPSETGEPSDSAGLSDSAAPGPDENPLREAEGRLRSLLEFGRQGDVEGYFSAFADPLRSRIEREASERGLDRFADDLRQAARTRRSHAIFAPLAEGPGSCQITVETTYPDRNESQVYHLEQADSAWLVSSIETVHAHVPMARYGTPAAFVAPEGVPVQASDIVPSEEP